MQNKDMAIMRNAY